LKANVLRSHDIRHRSQVSLINGAEVPTCGGLGPTGVTGWTDRQTSWRCARAWRFSGYCLLDCRRGGEDTRWLLFV